MDDDWLFGPGVDDDAPEPNDTDADAAAALQRTAAQAEAQERALAAEVDRYIELLPAIEAAKPLPPQSDRPKVESLTGAAWLADRLFKVLDAVRPADTFITAGMAEDGAGVAATVCPPAGAKGKPIAEDMLAAIAAAGNLGVFEIERTGDNAFTLRRDGISGATDAWTAHGQKAGRFHDDRDSRKAVWDAAGLSVPGSEKGMRKRPKIHEFGEDKRGGTAELELPDGLTIAHVRKARAALRQSLNAPALEVGERGVHPVLHLNTKAVSRELPMVNPLRPEMLVRPRSEAERYAAASDFVIPVGVRISEESGQLVPILINQDKVPHLAVFGGTGSGKTVLLSQMVKAAVLQGATVVLWDQKAGKDLRELAFDRTLPGVVHYAAGSQAVLHRTIQWVRFEFEKRKAIAQQLAYQGITYRPTPLLLVSDEFPAWMVDLKQAKGDSEKAALRTEAHLNFIASQARELRVFYITAGQFAYTEGYSGQIRTNTSTLISLGVMKPINLQNLFNADARPRVAELAATIGPKTKGVGVIVDADTNKAELFRGFFNPDGPDADRFDTAVRQAPKQRRWAYQLPRGAEPGADGTWQSWTPVSEPSSDDLPARWLDDESGRPIPEAVVDDPTDLGYRPGSRPLPKTHLI
ncbi:ftsk/SpoIIIE family protein, putative [Mycobacteroides abscessus subsp. abscessus]|uniref:FtsK/SpoIIIE domain-containing protein n=1 Tax=Mycobacteroides abscessus TaxID=36809 RepID=UPI00092A90B8|nr:FtsK/SpoIIIE domain-containing protein [Mycobacteroides abscessus]SHP27647.1 ftsk/SpoIIIE family protein, putative [Mycobacteroides abscessus subsp. abscessus]SHP67383.1 ftsk/SpoIIIE family protein, putative [Mycobacteroides abscessus subsp. abscessus]SHY38716.1 ftsk/SpoIIIE family protein, putative [Mycobacteroides abscessus subsp. abscessus]SKD94733.1 ftsk/SpoIIIE family protein, putative [Mycobacteroides abscessus subsp. abscessus]